MEIVAIVIQEGGKLLSDFLRYRPRKHAVLVEEPKIAQEIEETEEMLLETTTKEGKSESIEAGCVPCAIGHFGTCSGLLNEAMRFAKKDGVESSEVIDRVNMCLDELNAMERVDLRPELIADLPRWEKDLANTALTDSRKTRHSLESLATVEDLERVAASTQTARNEVGRGWFKERLARMPKEEKEKLAEKAIEKLEEVGNNQTKKELEDLKAMRGASR